MLVRAWESGPIREMFGEFGGEDDCVRQTFVPLFIKDYIQR